MGLYVTTTRGALRTTTKMNRSTESVNHLADRLLERVFGREKTTIHAQVTTVTHLKILWQVTCLQVT